jgi:predicted RND superfamily exporter protein
VRKKQGLSGVVMLVIILLIYFIFFYKQETTNNNTKINIFFEENISNDKKMELINDINGTITEEIQSINLIVVNIPNITKNEAEVLCENLEKNEIVKAATISDDIPINTDHSNTE